MDKDKSYEWVFGIIFLLLFFSVSFSIVKITSLYIEDTKEHKFHYDDKVNIIKGFNKGSSGKIISYNERTDEYQVYLDNHIMASCLVKDNEIELKNE